MSGGFLVVLDRSGKDVRKYVANAGLVTLGSDLNCDIRILVANVKPHHASVSVRSKQTIIRDLSKGDTYVNGAPISVHALSHGDIITVGNRSFRWEYAAPDAVKKAASQPVLLVRKVRKQRGRPLRVRMSDGANRKLDPAVQLALELKHRASMPGTTKQVAVVQPRRRDAADMPVIKRIVSRPRLNTNANKRTPRKVSAANTSVTKSATKRTRSPKKSPRGRTSKEIPLDEETKASQWIASRKCTPKPQVETLANVRYVHVATPRPNTPYTEQSPSKMMASKIPKRVLSVKKSTPLRTAVLRKAITPKLSLAKVTPKRTPRARVEKIEDPVVMDKNKKAALMLLTRTPQSKIFSPNARQSSLVALKKPNTSPSVSGRKSRKTRSVSTGDVSNSSYGSISNVISVSDHESDCMLITDESSQMEDSMKSTSSFIRSPKKSSLKRPDSKRKSNNSSIKFDLSNIESDSSDVFLISDSSQASGLGRLPKSARNSRSFKILQNSMRTGSMSTSLDNTVTRNAHSPPGHSHSWNSQSTDHIEGTPVIPMERILRHNTDDAQPSLAPLILNTPHARRHSEDSGDSNKTDENAPEPPNEENITPKSMVKLIPEPVKQKHSTAKKPRSKRALIDNLDESDVIKSLFNSPVKRKLSRSMIEFNRSLEEEAGVSKRTRRTIAVIERTPDRSIRNYDTPSVPTDMFISPLNKSTQSPNLDALKRLFGKGTPRNDLTNVKGVKELLRTPQARKSIVNNLTNVSGVRNMFRQRRTPRDDLSDVRGVKRMFSRPQRNDLRRVSGVKTLFRSQKERRSPKNDLTDVRGVRRIFKRGTPQNSLNLSGVEELFKESSTSNDESLFKNMDDQPTIKKTYSKSIVVDKRNSSRRVASKSLTGNVSVNKSWLNKAKEAKRQTKAKNVSLKPNRTRELSRLLTDTLAGVAPLQDSRVRGTSSTSLDNNALPLKKRSLTVDVSKSRDSEKNVLPIKKRVILHSTPVKANSTLLVPTEMGKVSPIPSTGKTTVLEVTMSPKSKTPVKSKAATQPKKRGPKPKVVNSPVKVSPRKTRANQIVNTSPVKVKSKNDKRASLVIAKKPPVMSPKGAKKGAKKRTEKVKQESPKPVRRTRGRPKRVTSKNQPDPLNMTPRVILNKLPTTGKATRSKNKKTDEKESTKGRKRKTDANDDVTDAEVLVAATSGRSRKAAASTGTKSKLKGKTIPAAKKSDEEETLVAATTRGRKKGIRNMPDTDVLGEVVVTVKNLRGRGKKTELLSVEVTGKRRGKKDEMPVEDKAKGKNKSKKAEESLVDSKTTAKGRGKKTTEKHTRNANKDDQSEAVVEEKKQRGRKRKADGSPVKETTKRQTRATRASEKPKSPEKGKATRARAAAVQAEAPSTRGGRRRN